MCYYFFKYVSFPPKNVSFLCVGNHQKDDPNTFPELVFIKFPNIMCLPIFLLRLILITNQLNNTPQLIIQIPCQQLNYILHKRIRGYSLTHTPTLLFFKQFIAESS